MPSWQAWCVTKQHAPGSVFQHSETFVANGKLSDSRLPPVNAWQDCDSWGSDLLISLIFFFFHLIFYLKCFGFCLGKFLHRVTQ